MIFFEERVQLQKLCDIWLKDNNLPKKTFNIITFCSQLMDNEKVSNFIEKENKNV